jgi:hypothetical protein
MTSIRESIRRLLGRGEAQNEPDSEFAYVVYWTKIGREWDAQRRKGVYLAVKEVVEAEDFEANLLERRYEVPTVDSSPHAGASLVALLRVIEALEPEKFRDWE